MNLGGFLRWQFKGCYKNVQFWAFMLILFSIVMQLGGCPDPIPWYTTLTGVSISFVDFLVSVIRSQYDLYKFERKSIMERLGQKNGN